MESITLVETGRTANISTADVLRNFPRDNSNLENLRRLEELSRNRVAEQIQQQTLQSLRAWTEASTRKFSLWQVIDFKSWRIQGPRRPGLDRLITLVKYYFPPRGKTLVHVFDFGSNRAQRSVYPLGEVENGMYHQERP